ncbi:MAG: prepilin-type N-terminal cleavage/methylation domain-containing protein [Verrucomicrobiae bacterium]|nr:prepilin-type N-terminal cleavage/methylation domain-containing protein [Verrucomicrobiae bacterium]
MQTTGYQSRRQRQRQRGFNMVEIAICLGVIAIALVAIIGVMPTGMRVTQDNREETIIDQDARYFMQAIRLGAPGDIQLAGQVESVNGKNVNDPLLVIGMLSIPEQVNTAIVRGLSGSAAERSAASAPVAFRYRLTCEVRPFPPPPSSPPQLADYLHEVTLRFEWPLRPDGTPGRRMASGSPRTYRFMVSGTLMETNVAGETIFLFRP